MAHRKGEIVMGKSIWDNYGEFYVSFKNQGKPEKTPAWKTYEEAKESAEFLKFQGATNIRIIQVK